VSRDRAGVRFAVRDTGRGIAPEDLPEIMKPFRQASLTHEGTGLGLSISKGLVEIMGGRLEVTSRVGEGSEFSFALPLTDLSAEEAAAHDAARDRAGEARPRRVLVVEDDPRLRDWLVRLLRAEGYRVEQAENGKESLRRFAAERPELILMDLRMPVMDGAEAAVRIRRMPGGAETPIVALSADGEAREAASARPDSVFDLVLSKPISADGLVDALRRMFAEPAESRSRRAAVRTQGMLA
jgi:CheY-like chemotaxis protein